MVKAVCAFSPHVSPFSARLNMHKLGRFGQLFVVSYSRAPISCWGPTRGDSQLVHLDIPDSTELASSRIDEGEQDARAKFPSGIASN